MQELILERDRTTFYSKVNQKLTEGYKVVPHTLVIEFGSRGEGYYPEERYAVVIEPSLYLAMKTCKTNTHGD